ncbi:MAG: HEPN domain-containing protein [Candidatus Scalindua sp.]
MCEACYHSQQCVEKGLKTLILENGEKPERINKKDKK